MGNGLTTNDPIIVSAFHTALLHQGLIVLFLVALAGVSLNALHSLQMRRMRQAGASSVPAALDTDHSPEAPARRILRIAFGLLWVFDGLLQGQSSMPLGMVPQVVQPSTAGSPAWVHHLVNAGTTIWSYHPVQAAAATVWIQVGIGVWLLVARRGTWSRLGGLASLGWGLVVWSFGESFGAIFAPGLTWLFGAPGGVVFYIVAGALIALPERAWVTARLGRILLRGIGVFFAGMALLQAWPGRGSWGGTARSGGGVLVGMVGEMAHTPQPKVFSSWVSSFESFDAAHGWGVNLFVVVALAAIGAAFLSARPRVVRLGLGAAIVLCLADWVLIEDLGFFGGVGTDPNSMVPMALLCVAGYVTLTRVATVTDAAVVPIVPTPTGRQAWWDRLVASPGYAFRYVAALVAVGIVLVGGIPMAVAAASPNADPILATAVDGAPNALNSAAPPFSLVNQHDRDVTLASLRGKTVALTFLDPVCTSDCPIIAQEFRQADSILGGASKNVEFIAIDANPRYIATAALVAFDNQENLGRLSNWLYLTGTDPQLRHIWNAYGILVGYASGGAMIAHSDTAYVINRNGQLRSVLNADPGGATAASESSFAVTLADAITSARGGS